MMQNYAKFDSRIAQESMKSSNYGYDNLSGAPSMYDSSFDFLGNIVNFFIASIVAVSVLFGLFLFIYIFISLFSKGGKETTEELKALLKWFAKLFKNIFGGTYNKTKSIFSYFLNRKMLSFLLIIIFLLINFGYNVINGNSKLLKLSKIENGYVGVDLKNNTVLNPGYHLYSPIKTNYFLSPTNNFDFEIVEVTANTKEDLGVTLDYRVGFKLKNDRRLDFYNTYGAKNIRLVSSDVVMPRLLETIKGIIRNYGFKDISSKHSEIKDITLSEANKVLLPIGIELQDITILDIRLPKSYLASKEDLLRSENALKLAEARLEAQKKESEKKIIEAENLKKIKIIEAEAIAEYNKIVTSENIDKSSIEMKKLEIERLKIEKWDGKLPSNIQGDFGL